VKLVSSEMALHFWATALLVAQIAAVTLADSPAKQERSVLSSIHDRFHHTTPASGRHDDSLPADYQQRSARVKQEFLWKRIQQTAFTRDNMNTVPHADKANLTNIHFLLKSFTHVGDEVPEGRQKLSHQFAAVAKVQLQIFANSPYTGVLAPGGASIAILRLSVAKYDDPLYMSPGFALKILIDGKPSVNMHSFFSSEGQSLPDNNYFRTTLTQVVPEPFTPTLLYLGKFFNQTLELLPPAPDRPENNKVLGMTEFASIYPNRGEPVPIGDVVAPYKVEWVPNPLLTAKSENRTGTDFRLQLLDIPENTVLYDLVAHRLWDSDGVFIGRVVSRSAFIASQYGDEVLFFQHANKRWQA